MSECQYCHTDYPKGKAMHEKYCKENPVNKSKSSDPAGAFLKEHQSPPIKPFVTTSVPPADENHQEADKIINGNSKNKPGKTEATFEEILRKLPKWSIKEKKPFFSPKKKGNTWVQFVGFSRTRPPVCCWTEYDGECLSVNDLYFPAPHDIRGGIFPYDLDKGVPLLENSEDFKEMSYWNKLVHRVKNMYFTLGLVTGAGDFTKNIGLILLLVALVGLIGIGNIYMTWQLSNGLAAAQSQANNLSIALNEYMILHP